MRKTRQEIAYEDAELELLIKCKDKDICSVCDGGEWCIKHFSQEVRNRYVAEGHGCICGVDCRKYCKNAKECLGDN